MSLTYLGHEEASDRDFKSVFVSSPLFWPPGFGEDGDAATGIEVSADLDMPRFDGLHDVVQNAVDDFLVEGVVVPEGIQV